MPRTTARSKQARRDAAAKGAKKVAERRQAAREAVLAAARTAKLDDEAYSKDYEEYIVVLSAYYKDWSEERVKTKAESHADGWGCVLDADDPKGSAHCPICHAELLA